MDLLSRRYAELHEQDEKFQAQLGAGPRTRQEVKMIMLPGMVRLEHQDHHREMKETPMEALEAAGTKCIQMHLFGKLALK